MAPKENAPSVLMCWGGQFEGATIISTGTMLLERLLPADPIAIRYAQERHNLGKPSHDRIDSVGENMNS
jgi:hypothetical protein